MRQNIQVMDHRIASLLAVRWLALMLWVTVSTLNGHSVSMDEEPQSCLKRPVITPFVDWGRAGSCSLP